MKLAIRKVLDSPTRVITDKVAVLLKSAFDLFPVCNGELDIAELTRIKNDIALLLLILRSSRLPKKELPRTLRTLISLQDEAAGCFCGINERVSNTIVQELNTTVSELKDRLPAPERNLIVPR